MWRHHGESFDIFLSLSPRLSTLANPTPTELFSSSPLWIPGIKPSDFWQELLAGPHENPYDIFFCSFFIKMTGVGRHCLHSLSLWAHWEVHQLPQTRSCIKITLQTSALKNFVSYLLSSIGFFQGTPLPINIESRKCNQILIKQGMNHSQTSVVSILHHENLTQQQVGHHAHIWAPSFTMLLFPLLLVTIISWAL